MPKLNDTQTMLLSTALQRESLSLYPLADVHAKAGPRVTKAITSLVARGFVVERETDSLDITSRIDGDVRYALFATQAGLAAIGVSAAVIEAASPAPEPTVLAPRASKTEIVLSLLRRNGGATLPDLIAATDWLPHTTRAALTGLRKKGHAIERFKHSEVTTYRIAG